MNIRRVFGGSFLLLALIGSVLAIGGGAALAQTGSTFRCTVSASPGQFFEVTIAEESGAQFPVHVRAGTPDGSSEWVATLESGDFQGGIATVNVGQATEAFVRFRDSGQVNDIACPSAPALVGGNFDDRPLDAVVVDDPADILDGLRDLADLGGLEFFGSCSLNSDGLLSWIDLNADGDRYHVRLFTGAGSSTFLRTVVGFQTQLEPFTGYVLRWRVNGEVSETSCSRTLAPGEGLDVILDPADAGNGPRIADLGPNCAVSGRTLGWNDLGADGDRYHVRVGDAAGSTFESTVVGFETQVSDLQQDYLLRWRVNGQVMEQECQNINQLLLDDQDGLLVREVELAG